ncbi:MAG: transporter [Nitrospinae bacterium]|nr:transporter [Nitrospinota bacterium]
MFDEAVQLLIKNPLLYLFAVAAVGYPIGRIKVFGVSLGVAAVLFTGLGFGSLHPDLKLPEIIYVLGLVLFVYTVGLASGPAFAASFKRDGVRNNLFAVGILAFAAGFTFLLARLLAVKPTLTAGMFAGSLTNTPAIAGVLETIKSYTDTPALESALSEPVIAYSITYPVGVIGMLLAITLAQRLLKIDYKADAARVKGAAGSTEPLHTHTILVTRKEAEGQTLRSLFAKHKWNVAIGRVKHDGHMMVATGASKLAVGDLVAVVGPEEELTRIAAFLGELSAEHIERDKSELEVRRIFVSNQEIEGRQLRHLKVDEKFGAVVTRLRRGDVDMVVSGSTTLEPGDRVRVVARRERMVEISAFFGDSYRAVSEIDIMTFSLGLAVGLAIGAAPIPMPGGVTVKLGFAGGPLIVGLILGIIGRTGDMVWTIPYSVNMTLRQIGLVLFLAGVGTKAGYGFFHTMANGGGLYIFFAGAVITFGTAMLTLTVGYKLLKIPFCVLTGMLAGLQTQPAVLGFALEQSKNDLPNVGYASVYPTATILKILLAQALLVSFGL